MMYVNQSQAIIQTYQQKITGLRHIVSDTELLERLLKIVDNAIRFYTEMKNAIGTTSFSGFSKLHHHLVCDIEILATVQSINLAQELTCPDGKGLYFFHRMSWQKFTGRICLALYSLLRNIKFVDKFGFIQLGMIGQATVRHLPIFNLATDCTYIFYRSFIALEGIRTKTWWRVAVSVGKVFVVVSMLAMKAWNVQASLCTLTVIGLSLAIDVFVMTKRFT